MLKGIVCCSPTQLSGLPVCSEDHGPEEIPHGTHSTHLRPKKFGVQLEAGLQTLPLWWRFRAWLPIVVVLQVMFHKRSMQGYCKDTTSVLHRL